MDNLKLVMVEGGRKLSFSIFKSGSVLMTVKSYEELQQRHAFICGALQSCLPHATIQGELTGPRSNKRLRRASPCRRLVETGSPCPRGPPRCFLVWASRCCEPCKTNDDL